MKREIYLISDLHLGGAPGPKTGSRGFRMMTHEPALAAFLERIAAQPGAELVINGDFVDFLAEEHLEGDLWQPFIWDPREAVATFHRIADRMPEVFAALGRLAGRLTLLLGNHDLEMALPGVRRAFAERTGLREWDWRFLLDSEALVAGSALIEHGNSYDPANSVDHDALRRVRALHSRHKYTEAEAQGFVAPPGSRMVSRVMNDIKRDFAFVDLLKPQSEALVAMILALDPDRRSELAAVAWSLKGAVARTAGKLLGHAPDRPFYRAEIGSYSPPEAAAGSLEALLAAALPPEKVPLFAADDGFRKEISAAGKFALLTGLVRGKHWGWERRVAQLAAAIKALQGDQTFSLIEETDARYRDAAAALSRHGKRFSHVIFGHTHHAKDLELEGGGRYLNSGTWADLMRFPADTADGDPEIARAALETFLFDCGAGRLDRYLEFSPGCVHLEIGETTTARYRPYDPEADRLL